VLCWLAAQLGVSEPPLASQSPLKPGTAASRDAVARFRASKRCCNARLRASGFQFRYPSYREGYATLLHSA